MHNVGQVDSSANVIFLAADERYASPHTTFLFHGMNYTFSNPTVDFAVLRDAYLRSLFKTNCESKSYWSSGPE